MKNPVLSVCVCTLGGADRVAETLWSLVCQSASPDAYEVLVIENDAKAQAAMRQVVDAVRKPEIEIRLVVEPKLGLSNARNRAIAESLGEYVFFIDDDAIASPRLVESYLRAIAKSNPDVIGGNVEPHFVEFPPPELGYDWWPHWSLKHFGAHDRWLRENEYFLGTNVGASRALLEQHSFDTRLGRTGGDLAGGEEWYLGDARFRRLFVANATVFHSVPVERMQPEYIVRRMFFGTLSRARQRDPNAVPANDSVFARIRMHLERPLAQGVLLARKFRWFLRVANERRRFRREMARAQCSPLSRDESTACKDATSNVTGRAQ